MTEPRQSARWILLPALTGLILVAVLILYGLAGPAGKAPLAPAVTFRLIDGTSLSMAALRGRPALVVFWATTCKTCLHEVPYLNALFREYGTRDVAVVAVAMPYDPPARVYEFARKLPIDYPVALDIDATITRAFGNVRTTPTAWLIGPDGRVAWKNTGPLASARLRATLTEMIEPARS